MIEKRNIGLSILFAILTCGIYSMYWLVKLTDEAGELSGDRSMTGGMSLLLTIVTCGIYGFFWNYKMGKVMYKAKERSGMVPQDNSVLYLILAIFGLGIVSYCIIQSEINEIIA